MWSEWFTSPASSSTFVPPGLCARSSVVLVLVLHYNCKAMRRHCFGTNPLSIMRHEGCLLTGGPGPEERPSVEHQCYVPAPHGKGKHIKNRCKIKKRTKPQSLACFFAIVCMSINENKRKNRDHFLE